MFETGDAMFVYGTLRRGRRAHHLVRGGRSMPGRVRGRVVACGPYPALIPGGGGGWVAGELIEIRAKQLAALDRYEGPSYRRVRIAVRTAAGRRVAWVYVLPMANPSN